VPDDQAYDCFRAIDKLDKIGRDGVLKELKDRGFNSEQSEFLIDAIAIKGTGQKTLQKFRDLLEGSDVGLEGVDELTLMAEIFEQSEVGELIEFDMSLARGLDYYTGPVFEGRYLGKPVVGSILGGGRYDHLIENFGGTSTPATGISLGIGRLIEVVIARGGAKVLPRPLEVFIAPIKRPMLKFATSLQTDLVRKGISCEVDLMDRPLKKLLEQADSKKARFTVIVGERDIAKGEVSVRNMKTKETEQVRSDSLTEYLLKAL
ncbi:MAG: His/Gly/Thr/Pro-type tRNA ligase C-terminal domain-containing protein, partial [Candidatus Thorarchaeota archaeon]